MNYRKRKVIFKLTNFQIIKLINDEHLQRLLQCMLKSER